jgi:transposase
MEDSKPLLLELVDHACLSWCLSASPPLDAPIITVSAAYPPAVGELCSTWCADGLLADSGWCLGGAAADSAAALALLPEHLELRQQAGYWKTMHERVRARLAACEAEVAALQAKLKLRERQAFGRKSEKSSQRSEASTSSSTADAGKQRRQRGQQRGQPQPTRRNYDHLPITEEVLDIPAAEQQCPCCGLPWQAFPGTEDNELIEIEVRAYRRQYRRRRYRPTCQCGVQPGIITAPGPDKLLPRSRFGISVWVTVLLDKFAFARPTHRLLEDLRTQGLDLAEGTLAEGLQRLVPLLTPLTAALVQQQRQEDQWHADETRWSVFVFVAGKVGHRWYLWMIRSATAVVFILVPGRGHDVPEAHFGPEARGILIVDRYSAYKALPQVKAGQIILAFCWAHQRRDFLELANAWPLLQAWAQTWLEAIGNLYYRNDQRLEVQADPAAFAARDRDLRHAVDAFAQRWQSELQQPDLHPAAAKVLTSLREHWAGLTVFVEHPEVPMDNNAGERTIRDPVMGRKNYFGCGALWSVQLAATMFSLVATLRLWQINPRRWLTAYFQACAAHGGQVPAQPESFLPWNLTPEQRQAFRLDESDAAAGSVLDST